MEFLDLKIFFILCSGLRLSWMTNSALVYEPKCGGREGVAEQLYTEDQINFGDLSPYLTYDFAS